MKEETKRKLSESTMRFWAANPQSGMTGKHHSEETKMKIGNIHRGKIISNETRNKISKAREGFKHTAEAKLKMSLAGIGRKYSPMSLEQRKRVSERTKELWKDKYGYKYNSGLIEVEVKDGL